VRGYKNLASMLVDLGELGPSRALHERGRDAALSFGDRFNVGWFDVELALQDWYRGNWDPALATLESFLAEVDAGESHYMAAQAYWVRARIRAGRGDVRGAREDAARSLGFGRRSRESQVLLPALAVSALVAAVAGDVDGVASLAADVEALVPAERFAGPWALELASALVLVDVPDRFPVWATLARTRWGEATEALLGGDAARAASVCAEIGSAVDEAFARTRAAEALVAAGRLSEAERELARARAVYRDAGATLWLRRAEGVLAESA
jgi:hypothetical protein